MSTSGGLDVPAATQARPPRPTLTKSQVAALILAVVVIVFAVLNGQTVKVHWIFTTTRSPLILVIIVAGLLGAAISAFVRRRRERRTQPPPPAA